MRVNRKRGERRGKDGGMGGEGTKGDSQKFDILYELCLAAKMRCVSKILLSYQR